MIRLIAPALVLAFTFANPARADKRGDLAGQLGGILVDEVRDYLQNANPNAVCINSWLFGEERNRCVQVASTGTFDMRAVKVCQELFTNKVECLEAIKDKSYGPLTIRACDQTFNPSGTVACLRDNGTPVVAARDANEATRNFILNFLWKLLDDLIANRTSTSADGKDAQREHLLRMIQEIKGKGPAADGVINPPDAHGDPEAQVVTGV